MPSKRFDNALKMLLLWLGIVFIIALRCIYYAFKMTLLYLYYVYIILLLHYFKQYNIYIHSLESSQCGVLLESSQCGVLLESSLSNSHRSPSLNRLVKILVHEILDIGIVMRVCWTRRTTCMNKMDLWNLIENRDWIDAMPSCIRFSLSFKYRAS